MRAAPHRGSWVKVVHVHVRTLTVFFSVFPAVTQSTAVASRHRAGVFRVRLEGRGTAAAGNSVSKHVQTAPWPASALGEVNAPFETQVSAITHTTY